MKQPRLPMMPAMTWREENGPLTAELIRMPAQFGLGQIPAAAGPPVAVSRSVCGFCSTGCGLLNHLDAEGRALRVTPDPAYPVNLGMACPKGWEALTPLDSPERGTTPLVDGAPAPWTTAAGEFCARMRRIMREHGPESVAFLSTGQLMTEEMALLGAVAKFGMGFIHGDGNTRQCMATAVTAYRQSFGFDAPPFTYADFEQSDVLVFVGANPCIAHPIMWQRVLGNPHRPEIVVIDPRRTETALAATRHLAVRPKGDLALLCGLAHVLIREGWVDRAFVDAHTTGFDAFRAFVTDFTPARVAAESGISAGDVESLARSIAQGRAVSFWWTMGVNQGHQATRTAQAIVNLALLTGNIGRPGTGANSITGQCNAMGSRLFSNTTNLLGGHEFTDTAHREKIAGVLGIPVDRIPAQPSLAYDQIVERVTDGRIRGLWIVATNPAHSWVDLDRLRRALGKLDCLVVQDMYATTATAQLADIFLPAAGWGEKEGTFINSERRIGVSRRVRRAPGQALADFSIFRLLGETWGCGPMFRAWESPEAVFGLLKECSRGQPCDITGIRDYAMLDALNGVQWPLREGEEPEPSRRLFEDGRFFTEDGRARFIFDPPDPGPEGPSADFPFLLLTGRGSSAQWHTGTRTGQCAILRKLHPDGGWVGIHPLDAERLGVADGQPVQLISRRGSCGMKARITATVRQGELFAPMHDPALNVLISPVFDPHSRQPAFKQTAVGVRALSHGLNGAFRQAADPPDGSGGSDGEGRQV